MMRNFLSAVVLGSMLITSNAKAEITQADVNIDFGRFVGFWLYEGCEETNSKNKCWFIIERKKELYGNNEYFAYGAQKAIPAKAEVLSRECGDFSYTTGFTVTNLPNKAICIKVVGAGDEAELYYPVGYSGHGMYKIRKSSKNEFMRRAKEEDASSIIRNNR